MVRQGSTRNIEKRNGNGWTRPALSAGLLLFYLPAAPASAKACGDHILIQPIQYRTHTDHARQLEIDTGTAKGRRHPPQPDASQPHQVSSTYRGITVVRERWYRAQRQGNVLRRRRYTATTNSRGTPHLHSNAPNKHTQGSLKTDSGYVIRPERGRRRPNFTRWQKAAPYAPSTNKPTFRTSKIWARLGNPRPRRAAPSYVHAGIDSGERQTCWCRRFSQELRRSVPNGGTKK